MKRLFFTVACLLSIGSLFAQKWVVDFSYDFKDGQADYFADVEDYCDYYFIASINSRGYQSVNQNEGLIRRGRNRLFTVKREGGYSYPSFSYLAHRGNPHAKIQVDFPYAFPVKQGDSIRTKPKMNSSAYTTLFMLQYASSDTIYACREGVVCDNDLYFSRSNTKTDLITLYHRDGSFGNYGGYATSLVYPGDYVKMGQAIAIAGKKGVKQEKVVEFAVYFLDRNKMKNRESGSKHTNIRPFFHSANAGNARPEEKTAYISEITEDMLMQDMSKKEIKNYLKKKKQ
jgi:hypothetical protein